MVNRVVAVEPLPIVAEMLAAGAFLPSYANVSVFAASLELASVVLAGVRCALLDASVTLFAYVPTMTELSASRTLTAAVIDDGTVS